MAQEIAQAGIRSLVAYLLLLLSSRFMGRKMISHMTVFDFIVGIMVGSVAADIAINRENHVTSGISALIVLTIIAIIVDYGNVKSYFLRGITNAEPVILIENGKIIAKNLTKTRLPLDNLMMLLREKNVFNIADVEFAIFETDGKLSTLMKSQKQPVTPADLKIPTAYIGLTMDIIIDGKVMDDNLRVANLNREWLMDKLKEHNFKNFKDVFYAGLDTLGNLYLSTKNIAKEKEGKMGIE